MNISSLFGGSKLFAMNNTYAVDTSKPVSPKLLNTSSIVESTPSSDYHVDISYEAKRLMNVRGISEDEQIEFANILEKASLSGGYNDPKYFLNALSSSELETIQNVHGLANEINVQSLDNEGAFNLLKMPYNYVDSNNDGILEIGVGRNRMFPPADSPSGIVDAWNKAKNSINATEGLKQIISTAPFRAAEISANLQYDNNSKVIGVYSADSSMYTDIYKQPGFNWSDFIMDRLADLDSNQSSMSSENFSLTKDFLNRFKDEINLTNKSEV